MSKENKDDKKVQEVKVQEVKVDKKVKAPKLATEQKLSHIKTREHIEKMLAARKVAVDKRREEIANGTYVKPMSKKQMKKQIEKLENEIKPKEISQEMLRMAILKLLKT